MHLLMLQVSVTTASCFIIMAKLFKKYFTMMLKNAKCPANKKKNKPKHLVNLLWPHTSWQLCLKVNLCPTHCTKLFLCSLPGLPAWTKCSSCQTCNCCAFLHFHLPCDWVTAHLRKVRSKNQLCPFLILLAGAFADYRSESRRLRTPAPLYQHSL